MGTLEHTLVSGRLPQDGDAISAALDKAAEQGFRIIDTTVCATYEDSTYYVATLARELVEPEAPNAHRMTGGIEMKG